MIPIIDMGHRKDTPGKRCEGFREYEFNELVGHKAFDLLQRLGYKPVLTLDTRLHPFTESTKSGQSNNLNFRTRNANDVGDEGVLISIHANASDSANASGFESYVYKRGGEAEKIAKIIHEEAAKWLDVGTGIKDRGIKEANFYMVKQTDAPAVLIEFAFFTNQAERELLSSNDFQDKCATVVAESFRRYDEMNKTYDFSKVVPGYKSDRSYTQKYRRIRTHMSNIKSVRAKKLRDGNKNTVGISGTFQPNGILISDGNIIRSAASHMWRGCKDEVFMITKSGEIKTVRAMYASEIIDEAWYAIGGASLKDLYIYYVNGRKYMADYSGGFNGAYSDVFRYTKHTIIGNIGEEIHMFYVYNMDGEAMKKFCESMKLENYIKLDGGHIASISSNETATCAGTRATLDNVICLKEVFDGKL